MIPVLYVDDDATLLEVAKIYLDRTGQFIVTTALSGRDALHLRLAVINLSVMPGAGLLLLWYVASEMVNALYPEYFEMDGVRLQIVVREGQKVLIRKVD
jgi:CheY-like chemotaxis protein